MTVCLHRGVAMTPKKRIAYGQIPAQVTMVLAPSEHIGGESGIVVTPAFPVDAGNESMLATAHHWASEKYRHSPAAKASAMRGKAPPQPTIEVVTLDNVPRTGYRVVALEKRQLGGRAWKTVTPDGHYVDIREDVLLDQIVSSSIDHGVLSGEYVWVKHSGDMKLVRVGSATHALFVDANERNTLESIKPEALIVGHAYKSRKGDTFIYLGTYHTIGIQRAGKQKSWVNLPIRRDVKCESVEIRNVQLWYTPDEGERDIGRCCLNDISRDSNRFHTRFEFLREKTVVTDAGKVIDVDANFASMMAKAAFRLDSPLGRDRILDYVSREYSCKLTHAVPVTRKPTLSMPFQLALVATI